MSEQKEPYNPLAKVNLGQSVAEALLRSETYSLAKTDWLVGAGVYVIYYAGDFPSYAPLRLQNENGKWAQPIYIGKAVPKGGRKGGLGFDSSKGTALRDRLRSHAASIVQADNLNLEHFNFRALIVDDIWIPLGENVLIERFQPLWNRAIDGFGNKDPGNRRATQYKSSWDVLHPGRLFADKLAANPLSVQDVEGRVEKFFRGSLPESEKLPPEEEA